jgi:hypothetical protein
LEHHKIKLVKIPTWLVALATFGLVSVVQPCTTLCKSRKDFCKKTDASASTILATALEYKICSKASDVVDIKVVYLKGGPIIGG